MKILMFIILLFWFCPSSMAAEERLLSIGVSAGPTGDYNAAMTDAMAHGMNARHLYISWKSIESDSGTWTLTGHPITWAPAYYRALGIKLVIYINPIGMWFRETPVDLNSVRWNDPRMISRYNALLDSVVSYIGDETVYFVVGNEITSYLTDSSALADYRDFYIQVRHHLRAILPGKQSGMVVTQEALFSPSPAFRRWTKALADSADVWMVTYYGAATNGGYIAPTALGGIIDSLIMLAQAKPLLLSELGYPSSSALGSSLSMQADFISAAFSAWDVHKAQIPYIMFNQQWEYTRTEAAQWSLGSTDLLNFLISIGFHDSLGNPKPSWDRIGFEAGLRNFTAVEKKAGLQKGQGLICIYNPFGRTVFITMLLAGKNAHVDIFTPTGRRVARFADCGKNIVWNASAFPVGVYLVRASTAVHMWQNRISLLK